MSVAEIEAAISKLPPREFSELIAWLRHFEEDAWDRRIEEDLAAGRLKGVLSDVNKEYEAGLAEPL
jgi:hypothetical protein